MVHFSTCQNMCSPARTITERKLGTTNLRALLHLLCNEDLHLSLTLHHFISTYIAQFCWQVTVWLKANKVLN